MGFREAIRSVGHALTRRRREQEAAWAAVAESRGGTYHPEVRKVFGWQPPTIDASLRGVAVHVDLHVVSAGNTQQTFTRLRCGFLLGPRSVGRIIHPDLGPVFRVFPKGLLSTVGTAIGVRDTGLGDPEFDARFVVRTPTEEATRAVWSEAARRVMVERLPREAVAARRRVVTMLFQGIVRDRARIEAGVDLLAALGAAGVEILDASRSLDGAVAVEPVGPWDDRTPPATALSRRGLSVTAEPRLTARGLETHVHAEGHRDLPLFDLAVDPAGRLEAPLPTAALAGDALSLLPAAAPARVRWTGSQAQVLLPGVALAARIDAAADLAAALAVGPSGLGAYR